MAIIDVLKWDAAPKVFAYKYPNAALNTKSQLIVSESQEAVLVKEGQFYGPFGPGRHVLDTKNYPFLTKLITSLVSGGESPFTAEVWFVNKAIPLNVKWGTIDPIQVEDPKYHVFLPVRAFGQYGIQIVNAQKFLAKLVGRLPVFVEKTMSDYFKGIIVTRSKDLIGKCLIEQNISILQIASKLHEISVSLQEKITSDLEDYGVNIASFTVNSISTDEKDPAVMRLKEALAKRAEMNIIGYTYQQERSFDTMETAAGNTGAGGNIMNAGIGMGMGVGMGVPMGNMMGMMGQNLHTAAAEISCPHCGKSVVADSTFCPGCGKSMKTQKEEETFIACDKCGTKSRKGTKFCPNCGDVFNCCPHCRADNPDNAVICISCGKKMPVKCPNCGAMVAGSMKFCSECGTTLQKQCPNCKEQLEGNIKFCPSCGTKIN